MVGTPTLIIFDVNETLSDMSPMAQRFVDIGAPGHLAKVWFGGLLRDGFALTVTGDNPSFAALGAESLRVLLDGMDLDRGVAEAVQHVMAGFGALQMHPDVEPGVRALADLGIRLVTLTNGSTAVAEGLFDTAGLTASFERLMTVEDAGVWKPAAQSYAYALAECDTAAQDAMLVAVHPWDIDGAAKAGLMTAWINRTGGPYPGHFKPATHAIASVQELAERLRGA